MSLPEEPLLELRLEVADIDGNELDDVLVAVLIYPVQKVKGSFEVGKCLLRVAHALLEAADVVVQQRSLLVSWSQIGNAHLQGFTKAFFGSLVVPLGIVELPEAAVHVLKVGGHIALDFLLDLYCFAVVVFALRVLLQFLVELSHVLVADGHVLRQLTLDVLENTDGLGEVSQGVSLLPQLH